MRDLFAMKLHINRPDLRKFGRRVRFSIVESVEDSRTSICLSAPTRSRLKNGLQKRAIRTACEAIDLPLFLPQ